MPRESKDARRQRAAQVFKRLDAHMPDAHIELRYRTPLELLVAVMLSAQCTDARVNQVTPALFRAYATAHAYADATPDQLEPYIQSLGLFRSKAKNLVATGRALLEQHGGEAPTSRLALSQLAGVGLKTAGVVSMHLGGDAAFPVDTHVLRLSRRLGFTTASTPDAVEAELQSLVPRERWTQGHQLLVWHGRRTCAARSPACGECVVAPLCPRVGLRGAGRRA